MPYSYPQAFDRANAFRNVKHLLPGAFLLACMAGYINSVAIGFFHSPVSHMTGALSYFASDLSENRGADALTTLSIIVAFIFGAAASGMIIGARQLIPGRRYGVALMGEAMLICLATVMILHGNRFGPACIASACGLQNATTSSYCGLSIRTTHVTGTVTDFGVMLGHWVRHGKIDPFKFILMGGVVVSFGVGAWSGAFANVQYGPSVLVFAAVACAVGGAFVLIAPGHRILRADTLK
jgi:uncharacterized membrane protein YoaK (UPF0700 family)